MVVGLALGTLVVLGSQSPPWEDTPLLSDIWKATSERRLESITYIALSNPAFATQRAADGRGPLWWAYEFKAPRIHALLKHLGASEDAYDKDGKSPSQVFSGDQDALDSFMKESDEYLEFVPTMLEQVQLQLEKAMQDQNERFAGLGDDEDELIDMEDDESLEEPSEDVQARIRELKEKARQMNHGGKDEV